MHQFKLKMIERHAKYVQVSGVRRSDSRVRRNIAFVDYFKLTGSIAVHVLADWSKKQVLDYLRAHGVEQNPCYRLYGHSGNCMFCCYHDKPSIMRTLQDPYWRGKILDALSYVGRGRISAKVRERWLKLSKNSISITSFIEVKA